MVRDVAEGSVHMVACLACRELCNAPTDAGHRNAARNGGVERQLVELFALAMRQTVHHFAEAGDRLGLGARRQGELGLAQAIEESCQVIRLGCVKQLQPAAQLHDRGVPRLEIVDIDGIANQTTDFDFGQARQGTAQGRDVRCLDRRAGRKASADGAGDGRSDLGPVPKLDAGDDLVFAHCADEACLISVTQVRQADQQAGDGVAMRRGVRVDRLIDEPRALVGVQEREQGAARRSESAAQEVPLRGRCAEAVERGALHRQHGVACDIQGDCSPNLGSGLPQGSGGDCQAAQLLDRQELADLG